MDQDTLVENVYENVRDSFVLAIRSELNLYPITNVEGILLQILGTVEDAVSNNFDMLTERDKSVVTIPDSMLDVYARDADDDDGPKWTITGDLFDGDNPRYHKELWSHDQYQKEIKAALPADVLARVQFDSEYSQFFAYAETEADARLIEQTTINIVRARRSRP